MAKVQNGYIVPQSALEGVQEQLLLVLKRERIPADMLRIQQNKGTVSLFLRADLICRLSLKNNGFGSIAVGRQFSGILPFGAEAGKTQGEMLLFDFEPGRELCDWTTVLCRICERRIQEIPKQFDCCDRYEECSRAGVCTNPDLIYAMECGYKKLLKKGTIFYGPGRTQGVDNSVKSNK